MAGVFRVDKRNKDGSYVKETLKQISGEEPDGQCESKYGIKRSCKSINGLGILGSLLISSGLSMTKSGGGYSIECTITHKTSWSTYGSAGVASWLIGDGHGKRAVVMWSVPYSHWFHSNWLAVGLTESGNQAHKDWFDQMYYHESGSGLHFKRKDYYYDTNILSFKDEKFEITGIMGTSYKPTARIIIKPLNETDLAPGLKRDE
ncbi:unnamed protein product [Mytilus edulis]|uniref:Cytolysin n=1 Tax=Mytilus edulis TaxID=6550 RepID=A0A8S3UPU2_MYTED|nr:unnamed protein product [Mytilus edulis]